MTSCKCRAGLMLLTIFFLLISFATSLEADYTNTIFPTDDDAPPQIGVQGDAKVTKDKILLTSFGNSRGRAFFNYPCFVWYTRNTSINSFSTEFEFTITSSSGNLTSGGLTFFLAPMGSEMPANSSGGWLGLFNETTNNKSSNQVVAVEFDVSEDPWDPKGGNHIGIDVNSVVLPQKVLMGFSASTAHLTASHNILSWNYTGQYQSYSDIYSGLIISIAVTVCIGLVVFGIGVALGKWWRRCKGKGREDLGSDTSIDENFLRGTGPRRFSYKELMTSTDNFSEDGKLGEGGFGGVYKGVLRDTNDVVAVKRISKGSKQGTK
ncbi:hypothetical protein AMTR_s00033p00240030 [Amborella trichopoda]|uniref:Protein kinase domain-containing protein n=1 Tax=Amborella trichopoda TaxID=13333 RepID=U5CMP8_AMBTC|nr:hypothetical protein AMTR_s00033p00240030 [Amborella trichopoda]